jgi:hypothetical protein
LHTIYAKLNSTIEDYDLYVPRRDTSDACNGYWTSSPNAIYNYVTMWAISYSDEFSPHVYSSKDLAVRPVVSIPTSTTVEMIDEVWKILK